MIALRLPMAVKIPLVVTVFMAAVAMFVSERVSPGSRRPTKHLGDRPRSTSTALRRRSSTPWSVRTSGRRSIVDRARQTHAGPADRDGRRAPRRRAGARVVRPAGPSVPVGAAFLVPDPAG